MDRRKLSKGLLTGTLFAVGATAVGWAQFEPPRAKVVANGPMSLEIDSLGQGVFRTGSPVPNQTAADQTVAKSPMPAVLAAPQFDPALEESILGRKPSTIEDGTVSSAFQFTEHTQAPATNGLKRERSSQQDRSARTTLPRVTWPTRQTTSDRESTGIAPAGGEFQVGSTPLPGAVPSTTDDVDQFASDTGNGEHVSGENLNSDPVIELRVPNEPTSFADQADILRLPTLRVAQDLSPRTSNPVLAPPSLPKLNEPPVFELKPVPYGSPLDGPNAGWDDTLLDDNGRVVSEPLPPQVIVDERAFDGHLDNLSIESEPGISPFEFDGAEPSVGSSMSPSSASIGGSVIIQNMSDPVLAQYESRFSRFVDDTFLADVDGPLPQGCPAGCGWWSNLVTDRLRPSKPSLPVDVATLTMAALEYSPDVLALQLSPEIERKTICEEQAAFDWTAFAESTYDDVSDPVGNTLTVGGGGTRLEDQNYVATGGLRRKNQIGGEFELSQRVGYQESNSTFFQPADQATSRMTLSYTQPLMSQSGKQYQQSRTVLAMLETGATEDDTANRIQDHLLRVTETYWDLYRARALYLQRRNLLSEADRILATLEGRSGMDTVPRQLLRARSAVLLRRSEITRAAMEIRNAESRLRLLVGDPQMTSGLPLELLPIEPPIVNAVPIDVTDAARTAMAHRPDIRQAVKRVRSTGVRVGVTENELLPRLDFVFNGYISGLEGQGQAIRSLGDQFSEGRPSFAAGLLFEVPLGNHAAKARHHRRQLQMVQATHELEAAVEGGLTEVEMAVREANTSYREMVNRHESMQATGEEMDYLRDRWDLLPGGSSTTQLLEDLLDAQERLADDEAAFVSAQINYVLSLASLRRAMGTLLEVHNPACPTSPLAHDIAAVPPAPTPSEDIAEEFGLAAPVDAPDNAPADQTAFGGMLVEPGQ